MLLKHTGLCSVLSCFNAAYIDGITIRYNSIFTQAKTILLTLTCWCCINDTETHTVCHINRHLMFAILTIVSRRERKTNTVASRVRKFACQPTTTRCLLSVLRTWWRHAMETLVTLPLSEGNPPLSGWPLSRPLWIPLVNDYWYRASMFTLLLAEQAGEQSIK